jgi:apolipoprotein N-acyltransferase
VLICFEITDARDASTLARQGAHFIVNPTNDVWFSGLAPHVPWAAVRAVETGVPVVRAANAGVSAVFDRFGRRLAMSDATAPALLASTVPAGQPTLYTRGGNFFLGACVATVIVGAIRWAGRPRRSGTC